MAIEAFKKIFPLKLRTRIADLRGRGVYSGYPDQHKCIFIHIPKAAGTSVTNALFGPVSRHVPYFMYEQANPLKFARYFKFTFVRNPWDRLLSAYMFLKKGGLNEMDRAWAEAHLAGFETFEQFVVEWVNEENVRAWVHFIPQYYFICDDQSTNKMDFVGRMENLSKDFDSVAKKLGLNVKLPVINKTRDDHYSNYYTQSIRDIVGKVYAHDIELFDYEFASY